MSGAHIFVDETKRRDYLMVAAVALPAEQKAFRALIRELKLPGQRRLHMQSESDPRRRAIASSIVRAGVRATVYNAGSRYKTERDRRAACLHALVHDAARRRDELLVIEEDQSLRSWDQQRLIELTRAANCRSLRYEHRTAGQEQLLALPDAIAWCVAKGGDWLRRIEPCVENVITV